MFLIVFIKETILEKEVGAGLDLVAYNQSSVILG